MNFHSDNSKTKCSFRTTSSFPSLHWCCVSVLWQPFQKLICWTHTRKNRKHSADYHKIVSLEGIRSFGLLMCTKLAPCNTLRQIHWQWAEWQSDPFYRRWLMFGARSFFSLSLSSIRFTRVRIAINWNNKLYWISCVSVVLQVHCTDKLAFFARWFGVQNQQPRPTVILKSKLHKLLIEKHSVNGRKQTCVQTMNWEFNTDAAKKCIGMELVTAARVYFILIRCRCLPMPNNAPNFESKSSTRDE